MKKSAVALLLLVLLVGSFLGGAWYNRGTIPQTGNDRLGRKVLYYVDPMNPAHTSEKPGPAPCGMPMEPVYADDEGGGPGNSPQIMPPGSARITPAKQQLMGIRVEAVEATSRQHALRVLGRIAADENRTFRILAGADGWVWDVKQSTTDSLVEKDQLMATVYNYEFLAREQQYLYALDFADRRLQAGVQDPSALQPGARQDLGPIPGHSVAQEMPAIRSGANPTGTLYYVENQVLLAKLELYNLGVGDHQLKEIARTRQVTTELEVRSPVRGIVLARNVSPMQRFDKGAELFRIADLSRVWILADVFEAEARYIQHGMTARVSVPQQGKVFQARATDVPPRFDQNTRTLKLRLETDNPDFELRPDMFVDVEFDITFPPSLNVPVDAVLDSGLRKTVFVDLGDGYFEPRTVETGWRFADRVEITKGLDAGERIAVSGNFFIDSESRMKLAAAGLYGVPEKDPLCGMEVYPSKAKRENLVGALKGKPQYFCSRECKTQFDGQHDGHSMEVETATAAHKGSSSAENMAMAGGMALDPVCAMMVHENKAEAQELTSNYQGKTFYFCRKLCKEQFDNTPQHYLRKAAGLAGKHDAPVHEGQRHD